MDREEKYVQGKSIPRNNRIAISDREVEEVLRGAKQQLGSGTGGRNGEKKPEPPIDRTEKKAREAKKAEPERKTQEVKKAEPEKKTQEAKKAEPERKVPEGKNVGPEKKAPGVKKAEPEKTAREAAKAEPVKRTDQGQKNREGKKTESVNARPKADFKVEDSVYVDDSAGRAMLEAEDSRISVFDIIGGILEFAWTLVKLAVVVSVIVGVVGFLLTRDLMIRGRTGERQSTAAMEQAENVAVNKEKEDENVKKWLKKAKREKLTLTADDGSILVARKIVTGKEGDKWAVILHGYNGSMEDIYDIAMRYAGQGYNILMPDLRANGESEGAFFGMGWTDRMDVINWIDVILGENPSAKVVVHGIDIGADAALMLSGEPVKSSIKAIVAEGAYTSAWDVVKKEYETRYSWPVFPIVNMINPVAKIWGGYTLKEADAVKQVKNTHIPILLIHGAKDSYATEDMTDQLDKAIASSHEVLVIATGSHEDCRYAEPDTYYEKTFEFVEKYVD